MSKPADSTLRQHVLFSLGAGVLLPAAAALPPPDDAAAAAPASRTDGRQRPRGAQVTIARGGLAFERNLGQFPSGADFVARGPGYDLLLGATGTRLGLRREDAPGASHVPAWLVVRLVGGDERAAARPHFELPSRSHYYLGAEPSAWIRDVPHFRRVEYRDVYRGIDLVYYGRDGELEYDFVVRPGANPEDIRLRIEGAERAEVTETGDLRIQTRDGSLTHRRPVAFQTIDGESHPVEARFELHEEDGATLARIAVGPHDASRDLVVDPVLAYSTYLGASGGEFHATAVTDSAGNVYVGGTYSSTGLLDQSSIGYVTKLSPVADPAVEYTVYLGGSGTDSIYAMAIGASGDLYVAGETTSADMPACLAITDCAPYGGLQDAFVAKFSPAGDLLYSRYLGGSGDDGAAAIAADAYGNFYVAGSTASSDFPVAAAYQPFFGGGAGDIFVSRFNAAGALAYSTYLGSSGTDVATAIAVGASGDDAYVAGYTENLSVDLPVPGALQPFFGGGTWDGYVAHLGPTGVLLTATRLGGSGDDFLEAIAVGPTGVVVAGGTTSADFPVASPAQAFLAGGQDATVSRLSHGLDGPWTSRPISEAREPTPPSRSWWTGWRHLGGGWRGTSISRRSRRLRRSPSTPGASDAFMARHSAAGTLLNSG